jgi:hypothetical protein
MSLVKFLYLFTVSIVFFCIFGCNPIGDQVESDIYYSETGLYGDNLLRESEINITTEADYSMAVDIIGEASVRVVFPGLLNWYWYLNGLIGWANIEPGSFNGRIFYTDKVGKSDMRLYFTGSGSITIEIYENGSLVPIRTRTLTW